MKWMWLLLVLCFSIQAQAQIEEDMSEEEMQRELQEIEELSEDIDDLSNNKSRNSRKKRSAGEKNSLGKPRNKQYAKLNHGLGVGLGTGGVGEVSVHYHYNLHDQLMSQLQFSGSYSQGFTDNSLGEKVITVDRYTFSSAYQVLFHNGLGVGAGLTLVQAEVQYDDPLSAVDEEFQKQTYTFQGLFMDVGLSWQTFSQIYFIFGGKFGFSLWKDEKLQTASQEFTNRAEFFQNIPDDFDHKSKTKELYLNSTTSNAIYIGFGYYFSN